MNRSQHYLIPTWPAPNHICAFTTLRTGGTSTGNFISNNMAHHVQDNPIDVSKNRRQLRQDWGINKPIHWLNQTHGTSVCNLDSATPITTADACMTTKLNTPCAVLTADCLPILLCNRAGTEVAAIHAGWRGILKGVIKHTVAKLHNGPSSFMAWLGPAIGPEHFTLNEEIKYQFLTSNPGNSSAFTTQRDKIYADIFKLAKVQLNQAGISNVYGGEYCTIEKTSQFYSYRVNSETGRMASIIYIQQS